METKLILLKHSNLFCREGWGGFNVPGARNEYNALKPHCLNSIYASEGRNTLLKSLLFRVVGAATGKGGRGLVSVFTCLGESSLLPCGLHSIGTARGSHTWDAPQYLL